MKSSIRVIGVAGEHQKITVEEYRVVGNSKEYFLAAINTIAVKNATKNPRKRDNFTKLKVAQNLKVFVEYNKHASHLRTLLF